MAVSSAVRGGALSIAGGNYVLAYLHRENGMTPREVRLVEGILFRTYFNQFRGDMSSNNEDSSTVSLVS
jgi:hypothetical protein